MIVKVTSKLVLSATLPIAKAGEFAVGIAVAPCVIAIVGADAALAGVTEAQSVPPRISSISVVPVPIVTVPP